MTHFVEHSRLVRTLQRSYKYLFCTAQHDAVRRYSSSFGSTLRFPSVVTGELLLDLGTVAGRKKRFATLSLSLTKTHTQRERERDIYILDELTCRQ
jgi:hypothetical protein